MLLRLLLLASGARARGVFDGPLFAVDTAFPFFEQGALRAADDVWVESVAALPAVLGAAPDSVTLYVNGTAGPFEREPSRSRRPGDHVASPPARTSRRSSTLAAASNMSGSLFVVRAGGALTLAGVRLRDGHAEHGGCVRNGGGVVLGVRAEQLLRGARRRRRAQRRRRAASWTARSRPRARGATAARSSARARARPIPPRSCRSVRGPRGRRLHHRAPARAVLAHGRALPRGVLARAPRLDVRARAAPRAGRPRRADAPARAHETRAPHRRGVLPDGGERGERGGAAAARASAAPRARRCGARGARARAVAAGGVRAAGEGGADRPAGEGGPRTRRARRPSATSPTRRAVLVPAREIVGGSSRARLRSVSRGTWKKTDVAVKAMHAHARERARVPARILVMRDACRHPNVVQFLGACWGRDVTPLISSSS